MPTFNQLIHNGRKEEQSACPAQGLELQEENRH